jgi:hypothetical protein
MVVLSQLGGLTGRLGSFWSPFNIRHVYNCVFMRTQWTHSRTNPCGLVCSMLLARSDVSNLSFPTFTAWRFSKLEDCTFVVSELSRLMNGDAPDSLFEKCHQSKDWNIVKSALRSPQWQHRLRFLAELSKSIGNVRRWGSGCACHEDLLQEGKVIECHRKGFMFCSKSCCYRHC